MTTQLLRTLAVLAITFALAGCTSSGDGDDPDGEPLVPGDVPTSDNTPTPVAPTPDIGSGPAAVDLGAASGYVILAKTGVSATGATSVVGHIGVSPADGT